MKKDEIRCAVAHWPEPVKGIAEAWLDIHSRVGDLLDEVGALTDENDRLMGMLEASALEAARDFEALKARGGPMKVAINDLQQCASCDAQGTDFEETRSSGPVEITTYHCAECSAYWARAMRWAQKLVGEAGA